MPHISVFIALLSLALSTAWGADQPREQRIGAQLQGLDLIGEAMTLKAGDSEFLALHNPAETPVTQGAVILLHDQGANPDWRSVIHPLRTGLPAHGWQTLSLQMPLAAADATPEERARLVARALPRIAFAVETLIQQNMLNICLLGHGLGARMALHWLAQGRPEEVRALVTLSLAADVHDPQDSTLSDLEKIDIPMLDIYGSRDTGLVRQSVKQRRTAAMKAENKAYRQLMLDGADRDYLGQDALLLGRIRAWLGRYVSGTELDI